MSSRPQLRMLPERLADLTVARRGWVLGGLSVLTLVSVFFAARVQFEFDVESLYTVDEEVLGYAMQFRDEFRNDDMLLLVVLEAIGERDVLDRRALTWQIETARKLATVPTIARVATLSTWELPCPRVRPPFYMSLPVVRNLPAQQSDERRIRMMLDEYDMLSRSLVSDDRRITVLIVVLDPAKRDADHMEAVVQHTRAYLEQSPPPEGYRTRLTGIPAVHSQVISDLKTEQFWQVPMVAILFLALLTLLFRHPTDAVLPLVAVGMAMAWTVGLMAVAGWSFNLVSNALPVLMLVIGVSNCVHILCRFREELCRQQGRVKAATVATLSEMMVACLLTCLTTSIGFLSLCAGGNRILRQFGLEAAAGMLLLYVAAIFCLGAGLASFRRKTAGVSGMGMAPPPQHSPLARFATRLGMLGARHPLRTLMVAAVLIACCLWSGQWVEVNSHLLETYGPSHPVRADIGLLEDELFGLSTLEVSLTADDPGRFFDPNVYHRVAEFSRVAAEQDNVVLVRSYVDLFETAYRSFRSSDPNRYQLPQQDARGKLRIDLSNRLAGRMDGHMRSDAFLRRDGRRARIACAVEDAGTRRILKLIEELEAHLTRLFPPGSGVEGRITGEAYLFANSLDTLIHSVFYSLCMAAGSIFVVIGLLFRSVRAGLTVMIPNVLPLVFTLGYMGIRGLSLDGGNVIVFAVSIGIAVDNTIHFLARLHEERRHEGPLLTSIEQTLRGSGRAIVLTTLVIILGLAVLCTSEFLPTRRFGELTAVTMITALLGDLIVLPACVVLIYRRRPARAASK